MGSLCGVTSVEMDRKKKIPFIIINSYYWSKFAEEWKNEKWIIVYKTDKSKKKQKNKKKKKKKKVGPYVVVGRPLSNPEPNFCLAGLGTLHLAGLYH